jgi:hypothetical protein
LRQRRARRSLSDWFFAAGGTDEGEAACSGWARKWRKTVEEASRCRRREVVQISERDAISVIDASLL